MIEFWRQGGGPKTTSAEQARKVEAEGWDGEMFMDSQSLCADPFVCMSLWAAETTRLGLCTGTTNPLTRHPAVTAGCMASVQAISGGRAVLGIGRGDSALAYLGFGPARLRAFRQALENIQTLLRGEEVDFSRYASSIDAPSLDSLSLGGRPQSAKLRWLPDDLPKVPLDVAATGPKVIAMAAELAERVTFSVGAIAERLGWAVELARATRRGLGIDEGRLSFGAQVIVACHPDEAAMRDIALSQVPALARFQVMQGKAAGPASESDAANFAAIHRGYDMNKHGDLHANDKLIGASLDWDFVTRFAIVGPPQHCVERFVELHALGIERFVVVGPGHYPEPDMDGPCLFAREVIPAVRAALAA